MRDEIDVKKKEMKVDGLFWFGDGVFRLRPFPCLKYPFSHRSKLLNSHHSRHRIFASCRAIIHESIRVSDSTVQG